MGGQVGGCFQGAGVRQIATATHFATFPLPCLFPGSRVAGDFPLFFSLFLYLFFPFSPSFVPFIYLYLSCSSPFFLLLFLFTFSFPFFFSFSEDPHPFITTNTIISLQQIKAGLLAQLLISDSLARLLRHRPQSAGRDVVNFICRRAHTEGQPTAGMNTPPGSVFFSFPSNQVHSDQDPVPFPILGSQTLAVLKSREEHKKINPKQEIKTKGGISDAQPPPKEERSNHQKQPSQRFKSKPNSRLTQKRQNPWPPVLPTMNHPLRPHPPPQSAPA